MSVRTCADNRLKDRGRTISTGPRSRVTAGREESQRGAAGRSKGPLRPPTVLTPRYTDGRARVSLFRRCLVDADRDRAGTEEGEDCDPGGGCSSSRVARSSIR